MQRNADAKTSSFLIIMIFFIIALMLAIVIAVLDTKYSLCLMLFIILSLCLIICVSKIVTDKNERNLVYVLCLIAFVIRFLIILVMTAYPRFGIPSDSEAYEVVGLDIANNFRNGSLSIGVRYTQFIYYLYNAIIYFLFGFYPSIVKLLNCFLGILTGLNIYFVTKKLFGDLPAKIAIFLTLFFPSLIFWQTMNLKESLIMFLLTLIVKMMIRIKEKYSNKYVILALGYCILLTFTRSYLGIMMAGFICLYFLYISKLSWLKKIVFLILSLMAVGLITYKSGIGLYGYELLKYMDLSGFDAIRKNNYRGGSEVLLDVYMGSPLNLLKFLPLGITYFLFSPFPWHLEGTLIQFVALIENIFWYIIFIYFITSINIALRRQKIITLLLFMILFALVLFYSASMGNMGLAYRMKAQLLPVFFIFVSLGIAKFNDAWTNRQKLCKQVN